MRFFQSLRGVALAMLMSTIAFGQVATLTGRITDQSNATIPQASVTATAVGTGVATSTETNNDGYYSLPSLPPGVYDIEVRKTGFQPLKQTGLELAVQQVARLDLTLKVGQTGESIEVSAAAPVLESEST